ncbi:hypothetical protein [Mucilaginibacter humi]|uniref:hypothetical protein n=1 Tax=Mucilaginibacter humi TaxID=2732510 RepID=UPI001C2E15ED|nr:hypothetical protein [Mucilaginibacter humi]
MLKVEWEDTSKLESTHEHDASFAELLSNNSDKPGRNDGDVEVALANKDFKVIEATYEVPALSHANMEPLNFLPMLKAIRQNFTAPHRYHHAYAAM